MAPSTSTGITASEAPKQTPSAGGRIGVGIVGAGVISNEYLKNLTAFPDLAVAFIADLDTARAAEQAEAWGVPDSGSYAELLAREDIEIVVNLTIPAVHVEVALQAVRAGKHVWSEKPYALDRESGHQLRQAAEQAGVRIAVAPDTFLGAGLQTALRTVRSGAIGTPLTALTLFQVPGPESWHPSPEFLFARGAGPLFDIGPYYLTTLVQFFGPIRRVAATGSQARATRVIGSGPKAGTEFPVEVPTHVSALIEFESGASAQSVFSFDSQLPRAGFVEIAGSEGTAVLPDPNVFDGETTLHTGGAEPEVISPQGSFHTRGTGVAELAQAIRADRRERVPGDLALHVLDAMVSIAEAVESGQFVEVASTVEVSEPLDIDWDPTRPTH
ncbi:Gfo/Idh/MocA family protein [Nesterenkonia xinjiangensis]|uniref:Putative dehydrogenase n=1 Tax=Nesterenkonia xinjiangensis TaxID=225327 RepID=A0A7Z0GN44_9MICC|nr:Gfo/Idh/MocA family oxidoreductase [Nesterenkonia xinjiangensis]NYJ79064.1 putative dehydrogenase [Nesterenkonia xinjiangensis]